MKIALCTTALLCIFAATGVVNAAPVCESRPAAGGSMARLSAVMATGRFVAYQPTAIRVFDGNASVADEASIEADLKVLRPLFDGLITYSASNGAERVADVAAKLGFRAVVLGVWETRTPVELNNALAAARRQPRIVVGISLGNERVFARETDFPKIARLIETARARAPTLAFTTSEPFHLLDAAAKPLFSGADFLLLNVHPAFQPWFREAPDRNAAEFVNNVLNDVAQHYCGPLLVKESGVPTAPAAMGFTPQRQLGFYRELQKQLPATGMRAFAWFSAFDAAWRMHDANPADGPQPQEGYWGLFDEQRRPKPVVREIPPLRR